MSRKHYKKGKYAFAVPVASAGTVLNPGGTGSSDSVVVNTKLSSAEQFERVVAVTEPITPTVQPSAKEANTATTKPIPVVNQELGKTVETPVKQETGDVPLPSEPVAITDEPEELASQKSGSWKKWMLLVVAAGVLFLFFRKK